jgi:hypothetical protein
VPNVHIGPHRPMLAHIGASALIRRVRHRTSRSCWKRRRSSLPSCSRAGSYASTSIGTPLLHAAQRSSSAKSFRLGRTGIALHEDPIPVLGWGGSGGSSSPTDRRNTQSGHRKICGPLLLVLCPSDFIETPLAKNATQVMGVIKIKFRIHRIVVSTQLRRSTPLHAVAS